MARGRGNRLHPLQLQASRPDPALVTFDECSSFAIHDLAALAEGNLSPQGRQRLAGHLRRCQTCMATLIAIVEDAHAGPGGETHRLAAWLSSVPWETDPRIGCADSDSAGES